MAVAHTTAVGLVGANLFITINRIILGSFSNIAIGIGTCYFLAPAGPVHGAIRLTQRNNHANISELLDNLLRGYDNSIRPDFGGPPAVIEVDIMVRSMGPISEVDMTYSMDCYFRQSWVDRRLAFSGAQDTLALSISMLGRIWKPDTYFYNGKQSYLHTITTPNKFVRLYQDGRVLYSSRLTIKAGCPMNLEDFPMDTQRCPLKFGSFGYTTNDVLYRWNSGRTAVTIADDMKLSQFDLVEWPAGNVTDRVVHNTASAGATVLNGMGSADLELGLGLDGGVGRATGGEGNGKLYMSEYSMLLVSFHLQRHMGNFLIQVYGPCVLLVVLSWVSFWLNREATADRVSLGITTVLTMTFLGLEARTDLPKVPYPTALDFFVFLSFGFIFATIIQFAIVHYFTKYGSGECYFSVDELTSSSDEDDSDREAPDRNGPGSSRAAQHHHSINVAGPAGTPGRCGGKRCSTITSISGAQGSGATDSRIIEVIPLSVCSFPLTPMRKTPKTSWTDVSCFGGGSSCGVEDSTTSDPHASTSTVERAGAYGAPIEPATTSSSFASPPTTSALGGHHRRRSGAAGSTHGGVQQHHLTINAPLTASETHGTNGHRTRRRRKRAPRFNSVSKIDRASRIFFPLLFLAINVFYWYLYLSRSERLPQQPKVG
ncbi:gamma-aminobutyric acid receptor alpha-like [Anopheles arabiensis]|uniref:Neurotransmitter-gated ion-channel ligand-binding domain-containing protein n=1 Tax=Anopheles arabiensis TaxID=7173 RepID=A0A499FSZ5_ANOAR|nr:gamma-aminobutyric acid receptor alpha-like [Anopheles arabiensis]XP_040171725.1 gamma-aminobutyric acid receptor alpha-like [Anopheles arabiensis]